MQYCKHCQAQLSERDRICPKCGTSVANHSNTGHVPATKSFRSRTRTILYSIAAILILVIGVIVYSLLHNSFFNQHTLPGHLLSEGGSNSSAAQNSSDYEVEIRPVKSSSDKSVGSNQKGEDVYWVLYITLNDLDPFTTKSCQDNLGLPETFSISFPEAWTAAKAGNGSKWNFGTLFFRSDTDIHVGAAYILPDNPSFAGTYFVSITVDDKTETVVFTLAYDGDYQTGSGWSITNIS